MLGGLDLIGNGHAITVLTILLLWGMAGAAMCATDLNLGDEERQALMRLLAEEQAKLSALDGPPEKKEGRP